MCPASKQAVLDNWAGSKVGESGHGPKIETAVDHIEALALVGFRTW